MYLYGKGHSDANILLKQLTAHHGMIIGNNQSHFTPTIGEYFIAVFENEFRGNRGGQESADEQQDQQQAHVSWIADDPSSGTKRRLWRA